MDDHDDLAISPESITITKMFPTPLANIDYPGVASINEPLMAAVLAREADDLGVRYSNKGGWQSDDRFLEWSGAAGSALVALARKFANTLSAIEHPQKELLGAEIDWISNAWANINRAGHANDEHVHPGSYRSGVYWIDDGRNGELDATEVGGDLKFFDPRGALAVDVIACTANAYRRVHFCGRRLPNTVSYWPAGHVSVVAGPFRDPLFGQPYPHFGCD